MNKKKLIVVGLIYVTLGIILGAMGAHYLETIGVEPAKIESFKTGVTYLFYNGIGVLALAGINNEFDFDITINYRFILYGSIMFSASIFLLVLLPVMGMEVGKFLGPITPLGGVFMIIGWGTLLVRFLATYKK